MPDMVMPSGKQHGIGGGLQSLTAFLVSYDITLNFMLYVRI